MPAGAGINYCRESCWKGQVLKPVNCGSWVSPPPGWGAVEGCGCCRELLPCEIMGDFCILFGQVAYASPAGYGKLMGKLVMKTQRLAEKRKVLLWWCANRQGRVPNALCERGLCHLNDWRTILRSWEILCTQQARAKESKYVAKYVGVLPWPCIA